MKFEENKTYVFNAEDVELTNDEETITDVKINAAPVFVVEKDKCSIDERWNELINSGLDKPIKFDDEPQFQKEMSEEIKIAKAFALFSAEVGDTEAELDLWRGEENPLAFDGLKKEIFS